MPAAHAARQLLFNYPLFHEPHTAFPYLPTYHESACMDDVRTCALRTCAHVCMLRRSGCHLEQHQRCQRLLGHALVDELQAERALSHQHAQAVREQQGGEPPHRPQLHDLHAPGQCAVQQG